MWKPPSDNCMQLTGPPPVLSEVVTCNCVRNPGGHAELSPRPSEEGFSFCHVLRPLDQVSTLAPGHVHDYALAHTTHVTSLPCSRSMPN